jgi:hypothetical protein
MASPPIVQILDQHQFDKYATAWSRYVSQHKDLSALFQQPGGGQMQAVRFSFKALEYLLSTVGLQRIKVRFILKEDECEGKLFSLVLYATDAMDGRISAYYMAQHMPAPTAPKLGAAPAQQQEPKEGEEVEAYEQVDYLDTDEQGNNLGNQIPNQLVHTWLDNWKSSSVQTADMFSSSYGPLTGYTFGIDDFLNSFFYTTTDTTKELLLLFGLHQHYPAYPDCYTLKQTFGLVLRIRQTAADTQKTNESATELALAVEGESRPKILFAQQQVGAAAVTTGQPFYDLSEPSPPN